MNVDEILDNAKYIEVTAFARYWEDAKLNGEEDSDGKMPLRKGDCWCPTIDLNTGEVLNWPKGNTAKVHYKVCDAGEYWLLDETKNRILQWKGYYVPDSILCIKDKGYGDYIIFSINENGFIENWKNPYLDEDDWKLIETEQD